MSAVLRTLSLAVVVALAYGVGRVDTADAAPCRRGLL
jgi:hypothetical protein